MDKQEPPPLANVDTFCNMEKGGEGSGNVDNF